MRSSFVSTILLTAVLAGSLVSAGEAPVRAASIAPATQAALPAQVPPSDPQTISMSIVGTYLSNTFDEGGAEIVAHDPTSQQLYIVNGSNESIDIVSVTNPVSPTLVRNLPLSPTYGGDVTSVDVYNGVLAVAVPAAVKTDAGKVVFFNRNGTFLKEVTVGALPDMVTFSPDGTKVLVANEGEPNDAYTVDPEGSVSIIDMSRGVANATARNVRFAAFNVGQPRNGELSPDVRIFGPGATVAQDIEPEYITLSANGATAFVSLQENNAIAIIDVAAARVTAIRPLGFKDHSVAGNGFDASNDDDAINIRTWPVKGMYMPDGIQSYRSGGQTYIVTANEGDARDYDGFSELVRIGDDEVVLDPASFPNAAALKADDQLGRLNITTTRGQGSDGEYEELYAFGGRSFSILNSNAEMIFDSGNDLEERTAAAYPDDFNSNNDENDSFDNRSDDKGPEPEGVATGTIGGRTYAFIGLERIGGVMVYDVTSPISPTFELYVNNRDFAGDAEAGTAGDLGPEGLLFVDANDSPSGQPLLIVANEVSGSTTIYALQAANSDGAGTLTLLHSNDGESSLLPIINNVTTVSPTLQLPTGGVAAFKTLTDQNIAQARTAGNAVVNVYAGDAFLASATLACSLPPQPASTPIYDAVAQRQIAYDAHIIGNHEFDYSPDFLERFIRAFTETGELNQPFLSANLDFSDEPGFADLIDPDGLIEGDVEDNRPLARSLVLTETTTNQRFGIVGATTPDLPTLATPRNVAVTPTITATAQAVQQEIDRLYDDLGVRKIIFVSHLQDVDNDRQIVAQLSRVDVAVAGGGGELLASTTVPTTTQLLPGEAAPIQDTYPIEQQDADGRTVYIVTTSGNYKYLGRIDVEFDADGEVAEVLRESSYPRRVLPDSDAAETLGLTDTVAPDPGIVSSVIEPVQACLAEFATTVVARTEIDLDVSRAGVRGGESNGGNLIADGFLASYQRYAETNGLPTITETKVIAVQNGGGIRQNAGDSLPQGGAPGDITRLDTLNVLPFDNFMAAVEGVTAAELKTIFERSAATLPGQGGQFLQVSGITVTYQLDSAPYGRVRSLTLRDGTKIVENGAVVAGAPNVTVVTNSFTANGGDNYATFANIPQERKTRLLDDEGIALTYERTLVEYLQQLGVVRANDPRYRPGGDDRIVIFNLLLRMPMVFR